MTPRWTRIALELRVKSKPGVELESSHQKKQQDANANSVTPLLSLAAPRECPTSLQSPAPLLMAAKPRLSADQRAQIEAQPVQPSGNLAGTVGIMKKTELELSAGTPEEIAAVPPAAPGPKPAPPENVIEIVSPTGEKLRILQMRQRFVW